MALSRREKLGQLLEQKWNEVGDLSIAHRQEHFRRSFSYQRKLDECSDELLWIDFAECLTELEQDELAELCQDKFRHL